MANDRPDIAIVGAGPAGLAAALALVRDGFQVALVGGPSATRDGRTVALLDGSVRFLRAIGAWDAIAGDAAPMATMRIIDDTKSLFSAPPLTFHAREIGLDAFGYNIENADLVAGLVASAERARGLTMRPSAVTDVSPQAGGVTLQLADGSELTAALVIGADGRNSVVRQAAHIAATRWAYPQAALTTILAHDTPHHDISSEFHTRSGPFTLVPLARRRSSLVWVTSPADADHLMTLDDDALAFAVERQAKAILGRMRVDGARGRLPMAGLSVRRFTATGLALVGEAAHVFPPIGAQGLNLGLRDAAALRDALVDARAGGGDALAAYERGRAFDVRLRTAMIDGLNRSLLTSFLPGDLMRGVGMLALGLVGPLRRAVMREGMNPRFATPRLMRAEPERRAPIAF